MNYRLYNDTLCLDVWDQDGDSYKLKPDVQKALLKIAEGFIEKNLTENDLSLTVKDVILIGSITNFNWTPYSDFDMHIIVDFAELDMSPEDAKVLVDGLKSSWNKEHAITIKGHPVELYIQDVKEEPSSMSSYSVKNDDWIKRPVKHTPTFDKEFIKRKHAQIKSKLDDMLANPSEEKLEEMLERIYDMRQAGLDKKGEFSEENIIFKILRAQGYLDRIRDAARKMYDSERSLDEMEKLDDGIGVDTDGHLTDMPDDEDDLVPIDDDGEKRVHLHRASLYNGVPIKVFGAYEMKQKKSVEKDKEWDVEDSVQTFSDYLTSIRQAVKHPKSAEDQKLVDDWIVLSIDRLQKQVPEIRDVEIILPLGSSSDLNLDISAAIKSIVPHAEILKNTTTKMTWSDVQLSPKWYHEKEMSDRDGKPRKWLDAFAKQLEAKKRLYPNQKFEIKSLSPGTRRYVASFYKTRDPHQLTGKNVLIIDDTLEQGATLKEALRSIAVAKPKSILVYIFLYKVMPQRAMSKDTAYKVTE